MYNEVEMFSTNLDTKKNECQKKTKTNTLHKSCFKNDAIRNENETGIKRGDKNGVENRCVLRREKVVYKTLNGWASRREKTTTFVICFIRELRDAFENQTPFCVFN